MNKKQKGFTLIELLVVIAIIGILSSIVLGSLNTARDKGGDAAVKENLHGVKSQIEIYYDNNTQNYTGACLDANVSKGLQAALTAGGDLGALNARCFSNQTTWVAWSAQKTGSQGFWCIDSTGSAKQEPTGTTMPSAAGTPCP